MRIISGSHKGVVIKAPKNLPARPTTDYCKESIFNILTARYNLENWYILDLFSGTGNMSFEFASRGCRKVIAVDKNFNCVQFIKSEKKGLNMTNLEVVNSDVFKYCYDVIMVLER